MNFTIESKVKKIKENKYLNYIPIIDMVNKKDKNDNMSYQFGDVYLKDGEYYFLTFINHLSNFVGLSIFKISDIKDYYKKNSNIFAFVKSEYIGNWFELTDIVRKVILFKIFKDNLDLIHFENELKEIIEDVSSMMFCLKERLELLSIKNLGDVDFKENYLLDIEFSINLNVSNKNTHRKLCVPFNSLYLDEKNNFYFYTMINILGNAVFYMEDGVKNYDEFLNKLINMKQNEYLKIFGHYSKTNIYNENINPLDYLYHYDKIVRLTL